VSAFATGVSGSVAGFYLAPNGVESVFHGVQGLRIRIQPGARYRAFFFNPRTGDTVTRYQTRGAVKVELGPVVSDAEGCWPTPLKPTMEDWVLVLEGDG
jgi:hypothetical protein